MTRINSIGPKRPTSPPQKPTLIVRQSTKKVEPPHLSGTPASSVPSISIHPNLLEISKISLIKILQDKGHRDTSLVEQAFVLLKHLPPPNQERNLKVAFKLAELNTSLATVAASLLVGSQDILPHLDPTVKTILSNRNQLASFTCKFDQKGQTDYFRSLLYRTAENHEVLLLLAIEDLIDLQFFGKNQQAERAFHATSWILKHLGFEEEGGELEDLAFLHLDPTSYQHTASFQEKTLGMNRAKALEKLKEIAQKLSELLKSRNFSFTMKYRVKRIASTAKKLEEKGKAQDINGLRVILFSNQARDCYRVLEIIREYLEQQIKDEVWEEIKEEFDDYIANPKPNGYRSLHALFCDLEGYPLEIQIRTAEMDHKAETGEASHAGYKTSDNTALIEIDGALSIPKNRFEAKKNNLVKSGVHFFYDTEGTLYKIVTDDPQSKPTLLDAAFTIGVYTGLFARGGTINGKNASLRSEITSGQVIKIQTGESPQIHGRTKMVSTSLAKALLQAAARGRINPQQPLEDRVLIAQGENLFREFVSNLKETILREFKRHFTLAGPHLKFSLERIIRRKGFPDRNTFFLTLALLEDQDRQAFLKKVEARIRENAIIVASQVQGKTANLELVTRDIPGVSLEILRFFEKYEIRIISMEDVPIRGSIYGISKFKVSFANSQKFSQFLEDIENLYRNVPPFISQLGKIVSLKLRIRKGVDKIGAAESVLREIFKIGANVRRAHLPEALPSQDTHYILEIQLPPEAKRGKIINVLEKSLSNIKGVGCITITC